MSDDERDDEQALKPQPPAELVQWVEEHLRAEEERHDQTVKKLGDALSKMLDSTPPGIGEKDEQ